MRKTHKGISKRFKITAKGKVVFRSPGQRHRLRLRNVKQKRRAMQDKVASPGVTRFVRKGMPHEA